MHALTPLDLSKIKLKLNKGIRTELIEAGWGVFGGANLLISTRGNAEAESLKEELRKHIFNTLEENKVFLQEFKTLSERSLNLNSEFKNKVDLLVIKLASYRDGALRQRRQKIGVSRLSLRRIHRRGQRRYNPTQKHWWVALLLQLC